MAFVKLDTGILDSTLWIARDQREVFITALLMAEPREFTEPMEQIEVGSLDATGFSAPPGWYGFVPAASFGIINRAGVDKERGMEALKKLGEPEIESRSKEFEGRRMIRVNGGFVILNYMKYRDKDHTAAERQRRLRERRKAEQTVTRDVQDITRDDTLPKRDETQQQRNVTQADADADADAGKPKTLPRNGKPSAECVTLYKAYPKHKAPEAAYKAINKALQLKSFDDLLLAVSRFAKQCKREAKNPDYIPYPATWFNAGSYDDEPGLVFDGEEKTVWVDANSGESL